MFQSAPSLSVDELALLRQLSEARQWVFLDAHESVWAAHGIFHVLVVLSGKPRSDQECPAFGAYQALSQRESGCHEAEPEKGFKPRVAMTRDGVLVSWLWLSDAGSTFERSTRLRQALVPLLDEQPQALSVWCAVPEALPEVEEVLFGVMVNSVALPSRQKKAWPGIRQLFWQGAQPTRNQWCSAAEWAAANTLARALTVLPPNRLTPSNYRAVLEDWAQREGWACETWNRDELERMGAGAFLAVARGSERRDAAIVCLRYRVPEATQRVALVGKGICFDTGGMNLKPAKHMWDMHGDMNGSAVALAVLQALSRLGVRLNVDVWLALAQNDIGSAAYRQNEVLTTLSGMTLEVVHTDAEGRLVLADALTLATRDKPDLVMDFATLTGSMQTALGSRYSGVFVQPPSLKPAVERAGEASGERMWVFPQDADYDEALESKVADLKQCTLEGEADHILATRLLSRFVGEIPWVHVDLSASVHDGGLGAVASDVTGFGVRWALEFLDKWETGRYNPKG